MSNQEAQSTPEPVVASNGVVRLKIEIVAADDHHALKIMNQLRDTMDVASGEKAEIYFRHPVYSVSKVYGNGEAIVVRKRHISNGYQYPEPNPRVDGAADEQAKKEQGT